MTQTFSTNAQNDIFIGPNGNLAISTGIEAVKDACATSAKAQLGEMVLAANKGVANFETVWRHGGANVAQYEASVRAALNSVAGVSSILDLTITVQSNIVAYQALIQTIYGQFTLNETVRLDG